MKNLSYTRKTLSLCLTLALVSLIGCGGSGGGGKKSSSSVASSVATSSSVPVSSSSSSASSVVPGEWAMVWNDEFDGTEIDSTKWSFERNCTGGGNNELQCYTNRDVNASIVDGSLVIVARSETFSGQAKQDDDPTYNAADTSVTRNYTSARLRTKNKGDWKYGRMDIRAKLPQGQGIWPAIWMLPTNWEYGGWPLSGEIDIMEAVNSNTGTFANKTHGTLHYGEVWPNNKYTGTEYSAPTNVWDEYHTFSIQWEEGTIRWYVDDVHFATQISDRWYTGGSTEPHAPFDKEFHLILNLAVGGNWPGVPNEATTFPQEFSIDYVRVYQCDNDSADGKGCATNVDSEIDPLAGHPKFADGVLGSTFNIFTDSVDSLWDIGLTKWDNNSNLVQPTIVASADEGRGNVINITYGAVSGIAYIQSSGLKDATAFGANGYLEFDVKVTNYGTADGLVVRADCKHPCTSGDISIGKVGDGVWETVTVDISDFMVGNFNIARVDTPFVIFPTWDKQNGVVLQVDNVRWVLPQLLKYLQYIKNKKIPSLLTMGFFFEVTFGLIRNNDGVTRLVTAIPTKR